LISSFLTKTATHFSALRCVPHAMPAHLSRLSIF
jgi:hypothetical protein